MSYHRLYTFIFTFFFICLFGTNQALAASVQSFEYQTEIGQISHLAVVHENLVLIVNDKGAVKEIYMLDSETEAMNFSFSRPQDPSLEKVTLSCHGGKENKTVLYGTNIGDMSALQYYRRPYDKTNGCFNAISMVHDIELDYYKETPFNRKANLVGRLKKFGSIDIQYYLGTSSAWNGKIKKINDLRFTYESWSSYGERAGYIGKYLTIGDIKFDYAEAGSFNKKQNVVGKIEQIGEVQFKYFSTLSIPHPPKSMMGIFSHVKGVDDRFKIFMPQE